MHHHAYDHLISQINLRNVLTLFLRLCLHVIYLKYSTVTVELCSWILGWGEKVEVLEPAELRQNIINTAKAMLDVYKQEGDS